MKKRCIVICGPTASGKSELADDFAEEIEKAAILIDSMQVYRELPRITNQARRRRARLAGIISVTDEWSVAAHAKAVTDEISAEREDIPAVLDAGTGMYLNASILDIPLAPKVSWETRRRAQEATRDEQNPRRASRKKELELSGAGERGSIWAGELRYETKLIYIKPPREKLDQSIQKRSKKIAALGLEEAKTIRDMLERGVKVQRPVLDSIGVKELLEVLSGKLSHKEAGEEINRRTRKLARRQTRWFDKLAKTLETRTEIHLVENSSQRRHISNSMHDIIGSWNS